MCHLVLLKPCKSGCISTHMEQMGKGEHWKRNDLPKIPWLESSSQNVNPGSLAVQ